MTSIDPVCFDESGVSKSTHIDQEMISKELTGAVFRQLIDSAMKSNFGLSEGSDSTAKENITYLLSEVLADKISDDFKIEINLRKNECNKQ